MGLEISDDGKPILYQAGICECCSAAVFAMNGLVEGVILACQDCGCSFRLQVNSDGIGYIDGEDTIGWCNVERKRRAA